MRGIGFWHSVDIPADVLASLNIPDGARCVLELTHEPEQVEGNASAWGEEEDREHAELVWSKIDAGEMWAWCLVKVTVTDGDAEGTSYLGCVSDWPDREKGETDETVVRRFLADSGADMVAEAIDEFEGERDRLAAKYCKAVP
jgi:hypothetical protein